MNLAPIKVAYEVKRVTSHKGAQMESDGVRLYRIARERNVEPKLLVDICQRAGIPVKNQLTKLSPAERQAVERLLNERGDDPPMSAVPAP